MKKTVLIAMFFLTVLILCGCGTKEQNDMEIASDKTVTFINGVTEADVWILPETEENLKTTLWGKATAAKVKTGESRTLPLCEPGDGGLYIFRMIDADGYYYSAGGITLEDGWKIEIKEIDITSYILEVTDVNGRLINTYEVFAARL